jgi:deazaflavin-dependent oxidoreductase (nitroreductase family)
MYQTGLGILMGKRFLLLEHTGRNSGLPRKAVLEVIRYDSVEETYYVVSAFGDRADWYQNISKTAAVKIQVGWKWMPSRAESLGLDQMQEEILDYARRNPKTFRVLAERLLGYEVGESEEDLINLAKKFIVVCIRVVDRHEE